MSYSFILLLTDKNDWIVYYIFFLHLLNNIQYVKQINEST